MNSPFEMITDTATLAQWCEAHQHQEFWAIDTEFLRERTYYPILCLVQIAPQEGTPVLIDALAEGLDLTPLWHAMCRPNILKIMHAARQDVEIFLQACGQVPTPLYDTQVAAQMLGFGESVGYEAWVHQWLGQELDKGARATDWSRRPLTPRQLTYAAGDVIFLREAYPLQCAALEKMSRTAWALEEMEKLADPAIYSVAPDEAWKKLKLPARSAKVAGVAKALAAWREEEAMIRNLPRGHVMRDEALVEIALQQPRDDAAFGQLRSAKHGVRSHDRAPILALIEHTLATPETWPKPDRKSAPDVDNAALELLQMLLQMVAVKEKMLPRLIATKDELIGLLQGETNVRCLHGWRGEMFGQTALKLLRGELSMRYDAIKKQVEWDEIKGS